VEINEPTKDIRLLSEIVQYRAAPHILKDFKEWSEENRVDKKYYEELSRISPVQLMEKLHKKELSMPEEILSALKDIALSYEGSGPNWKKIRHQVNPTMNKGIPFKVLPLVMLDIVEGTKRLVKKGMVFSGFIIDAKTDFEGDRRRKDVYRYIIKKISEMSQELFGVNIPPYHVTEEGSTDYFIFEVPFQI